MNQINVIHPYRYNGQWVFDDPAKELVKEPFVAGADDIIDIKVDGIPDSDKGFTLFFSSGPFPGYHVVLKWAGREDNGNWYFEESTGMWGWLCPALMRYFDEVPKEIYAQFKEKK